MEPTPFGRYALERRLGEGGMAEVWQGTLRAHGVVKPLVIKRIRRQFSADPGFVEMFTDEARIAMLLHHPNVVAVFDFGQLEGEWYMAMEYVQGLNLTRLLHTLLRRGQRLDPELVAYIGHQMCRGLHYAHTLRDPNGRELNIVHRDICPANTLVSAQGEVKVADFGIARSVANTYTTQGAGLKGHTAYMSPEQSLGGALDGRSDLFSLGIVLHECLTGRRLFRTETPLTTLEAIREARVPALAELAPEAPEALRSLIHQALARDPEDRPPDARALQSALGRVLPAELDSLAERLGGLVQQAMAWDEVDEAERRRMAPRPAALPTEAAPDAAEPTVLATHSRTPTAPEPPSGSLLGPGPLPLSPAERPRPRRGAWLALPLLSTLLLALGLWWGGAGSSPQAPGPAQAPARELAPSGADQHIPAGPPHLGAQASGATPTPPTPVPPPAAPPPRLTGRADTSAALPGPASPPAAAALTPSQADLRPAEPAAAAPTLDASPPTLATSEPPAPDPNTPGTVSIFVSQGLAEVRIDGKRVRQAPPITGLSLAPGPHVVQVEVLSTGRVFSRQITLAPGEALELRFDLD